MIVNLLRASEAVAVKMASILSHVSARRTVMELCVKVRLMELFFYPFSKSNKFL
jgi:hypothetical protein